MNKLCIFDCAKITYRVQQPLTCSRRPCDALHQWRQEAGRAAEESGRRGKTEGRRGERRNRMGEMRRKAGKEEKRGEGRQGREKNRHFDQILNFREPVSSPFLGWSTPNLVCKTLRIIYSPSPNFTLIVTNCISCIIWRNFTHPLRWSQPTVVCTWTRSILLHNDWYISAPLQYEKPPQYRKFNQLLTFAGSGGHPPLPY